MSKSNKITPHDALFKDLICEPETANRFLRERLPKDIVAQLSDDLPELIPGSFVDEELTQHHSDILYRVRLNGEDCLVIHAHRT